MKGMELLITGAILFLGGLLFLKRRGVQLAKEVVPSHDRSFKELRAKYEEIKHDVATLTEHKEEIRGRASTFMKEYEQTNHVVGQIKVEKVEYTNKIDQKTSKQADLFEMNQSSLVQGVLFAEVLGSPRSKKRLRN